MPFVVERIERLQERFKLSAERLACRVLLRLPRERNRREVHLHNEPLECAGLRGEGGLAIDTFVVFLAPR